MFTVSRGSLRITKQVKIQLYEISFQIIKGVKLENIFSECESIDHWLIGFLTHFQSSSNRIYNRKQIILKEVNDDCSRATLKKLRFDKIELRKSFDIFLSTQVILLVRFGERRYISNMTCNHIIILESDVFVFSLVRLEKFLISNENLYMSVLLFYFSMSIPKFCHQTFL